MPRSGLQQPCVRRCYGDGCCRAGSRAWLSHGCVCGSGGEVSLEVHLFTGLHAIIISLWQAFISLVVGSGADGDGLRVCISCMYMTTEHVLGRGRCDDDDKGMPQAPRHLVALGRVGTHDAFIWWWNTSVFDLRWFHDGDVGTVAFSLLQWRACCICIPPFMTAFA